MDSATKKPFLNLDFANVSTTELTGKSVFAYDGEFHKDAKLITRTELTCTMEGTAITLADALAEGAKVIVYGDTVMKTENGEALPYHMVAAKCAPQANVSLSFSNSSDPGSLTLTCDLMADNEDNLLDLILIEE